MLVVLLLLLPPLLLVSHDCALLGNGTGACCSRLTGETCMLLPCGVWNSCLVIRRDSSGCRPVTGNVGPEVKPSIRETWQVGESLWEQPQCRLGRPLPGAEECGPALPRHTALLPLPPAPCPYQPSPAGAGGAGAGGAGAFHRHLKLWGRQAGRDPELCRDPTRRLPGGLSCYQSRGRDEGLV